MLGPALQEKKHFRLIRPPQPRSSAAMQRQKQLEDSRGREATAKSLAMGQEPPPWRVASQVNGQLFVPPKKSWISRLRPISSLFPKKKLPLVFSKTNKVASHFSPYKTVAYCFEREALDPQLWPWFVASQFGPSGPVGLRMLLGFAWRHSIILSSALIWGAFFFFFRLLMVFSGFPRDLWVVWGFLTCEKNTEKTASCEPIRSKSFEKPVFVL